MRQKQNTNNECEKVNVKKVFLLKYSFEKSKCNTEKGNFPRTARNFQLDYNHQNVGNINIQKQKQSKQ